MGVLYALESIRTPALDKIMSVITLLGGELFFMVIAVTAFWCVSKREGYYLMIVGFFGTVINQFLKILCCVPRPWIKDPDFTIVESARAEATVVLTYTILAMVVCSGAFVGYLYLRGDTGAAAEDTANYLSALENGWKLLGATVGMLVSNIVDRKHIRFETQAVWWAQLIKLAVGFGCLLAIRSGLKAPLIALLGGSAAIAGGIRYLLVVLFAGCVWPLTFWWFSRLGRR